MSARLLIVGLGGTTRPGSTTERAVAAALAHAAALGCETAAFGAAELPYEPYDPSNPARSERALALVAALRRCDGLVIATPAYHGGVSGLIKNAIDFAEDLRGNERVYLQGRAVGCIVCADGAQAFGSTLSSLRDIVHALRGWPTPYGAAIFASQAPFGRDGGPADPAAIKACETVAAEVVAFARRS
jgi:FMN reductase